MAEKNALKSVKLPSFKVICLKLTVVCMVAGTGVGGGGGRGGEVRAPHHTKKKKNFTTFRGNIFALFRTW